MRLRPLLLAALVAVAALCGVVAPTRAFSGFGASSASATFGERMTFRVELPGGPPDRLELLLQFGDETSTFVAPVEASGATASFQWDASEQYVTPNTPIVYRWRATNIGAVELSSAGHLLYADNRPAFAWQAARYGAVTVHWYGDHAGQARHFGELSAGAVSRAEALLGEALAGDVDVFVYVSQDDFFGALGPGAREWTGAATYPNIRTVFMWLGGGATDYLETALTHELTHVVFHDATANPYHDPAHWLNEGFAVWSERQNASVQRGTVQSEANSGLFAFDAITGQFPIGSRGSTLAYAEGATMVDRIIGTYGRGAIAKIAAAYRSGATDAQALKAGTGVDATKLYADYFHAFGAAEPRPVAAAAIGPSIVRTPSGPAGSGPLGAPAASGNGTPGASSGGATGTGALVGLAALAVLALGGVGVALWLYRRRAAQSATGEDNDG